MATKTASTTAAVETNATFVCTTEEYNGMPMFRVMPQGSNSLKGLNHSHGTWMRLCGQDDDGDPVIVNFFQWLLSNADADQASRIHGSIGRLLEWYEGEYTLSRKENEGETAVDAEEVEEDEDLHTTIRDFIGWYSSRYEVVQEGETEVDEEATETETDAEEAAVAVVTAPPVDATILARIKKNLLCQTSIAKTANGELLDWLAKDAYRITIDGLGEENIKLSWEEYRGSLKAFDTVAEYRAAIE